MCRGGRADRPGRSPRHQRPHHRAHCDTRRIVEDPGRQHPGSLTRVHECRPVHVDRPTPSQRVRANVTCPYDALAANARPKHRVRWVTSPFASRLSHRARYRLTASPHRIPIDVVEADELTGLHALGRCLVGGAGRRADRPARGHATFELVQGCVPHIGHEVGHLMRPHRPAEAQAASAEQRVRRRREPGGCTGAPRCGGLHVHDDVTNSRPASRSALLSGQRGRRRGIRPGGRSGEGTDSAGRRRQCLS